MRPADACCFRQLPVHKELHDMIDHLELQVADLPRARDFYAAALAPLGYALHVEGVSLGFGTTPDQLDFWVRAGQPARPAPHFAFHCPTRAHVDAAYASAVKAGAVSRAAPVLMPQVHANYYAAQLGDPDGHPIEFACHALE
jgi:catechol 2,3-dioxygenase-like lactoylglutathione lyase family enzyme